jgi:hypothetical protein
MLGRHLGVSEDDITAVNMDEKFVKEKCYKVLNIWRKMAGDDATVNKLITVLKRMELSGAAGEQQALNSVVRTSTCL